MADGVKGIAIVVPDKALGPVVVAKKAKDAGIPLIAVDDDITYEDGSPVPYVGIDALTIGKQVGAEEARLVQGGSAGTRTGRPSASAASRTRRPTPACGATAAPRRPSSRPFPEFPKDERGPHPLRQHDGQRDRRRRHDADRQPGASSTGSSSRATTTACWASVRATENAGMKRPDRRDRRRHRRLALLRGLRRRQADRLPRHDVVRFRTHGATAINSAPRSRTSPAASRCPDDHLHAGDPDRNCRSELRVTTRRSSAASEADGTDDDAPRRSRS